MKNECLAEERDIQYSNLVELTETEDVGTVCPLREERQ